jgi:Tol biopolymer transport system component
MTTRAARAALVLSALVVLLPAVPSGASAFPGQNGKIVYIAGDDIFTVDPDGNDVANLTNTPGLDVANVSASPDGKRIVFNVASSTVLDDAGLYVINMNGTGAHDVLAGRHGDFIAVGAPAWSPDGTRIAFEAYDYPGFHNELFVIDADGTDLRKLTNCDCVSGSYPVWSPVGPEIAFVPCCSQVVMTINADTRATAEVFSPESGYASNITWSPDGRQIAYDDLIDVYRVSVPGGTPGRGPCGSSPR